MTWTGGCLCGSVRFECDATPRWISHCHCRMCRKQTGAALGTYVCFPAGAVRWPAEDPRRYRSSADVERSFCAACGGTIGFHRVHETSIAVGAFDRPEDLPVGEVFSLHVWHADRISWFETADDWPRHAAFPERRDEELQRLAGKTIEG